MFSSGCTQQHAVSFGRKRLSDAIYKDAVVCPCMTIRHQVMCIAEIQIISCVIIYLLPSIQQVKTVLVGQRMTSRAERTRTESKTEIIFRRRQVTVHHHLTDVLIPFQFRGRSRKVRRIRSRIYHAIQAQFHILHDVFLTFSGIPSGIRIARFASQKISKSSTLSSWFLSLLTAISKSGTFRRRRPAINHRLPGLLIPGMLQKVGTRRIRK